MKPKVERLVTLGMLVFSLVLVTRTSILLVWEDNWEWLLILLFFVQLGLVTLWCHLYLTATKKERKEREHRTHSPGSTSGTTPGTRPTFHRGGPVRGHVQITIPPRFGREDWKQAIHRAVSQRIAEGTLHSGHSPIDTGEGRGTDPGVETVIRPFVGFRSWVVVPDDGDVFTASGYLLRRGGYSPPGLYAVSFEYLWAPGVNTARCSFSDSNHISPHRAHGCGLYAHCCPEDVGFHSMISFAVGGVVGWGRVLHADRGWRAQHAAVAVLFDDGREDIQRLARMYQVPTVKKERHVVEVTNEMADWMAGRDLVAVERQADVTEGHQ